MARWNPIARGAALTAVASLALAACASSSDSDAPASGGTGSSGGDGDVLKIGTLLPLTGSLAFLGPPEVAGVHLAVQEINEAGGLFGNDVVVIDKDSSDTANPQIASQSVSDLVSDGVGAIIGAASSSVTLNVIDDITAAEIVQVSPANTATALSGYSDFYFRTAPPDTVQGDALANLILADGHKNVGVLVFNDDYGTGLRDVIQNVIEAGGGTITYGSEGQEFDPNAGNFSSDVQAILATNPDAIALISFDQAKQIIPELAANGFDMSKLYLVDGNTSDFSADFEAGTLTGAKGTIPGANPTDDFKTLLEGVNGGPLESYAYGPESYDATILVALAALRGGAPDGQTIQENMAAVSGANGGTECTGWVACSELVLAGEEIVYKSIAGTGAFNADNDPSSAYVGVYVYGDDNVPAWVEAVYGEIK